MFAPLAETLVQIPCPAPGCWRQWHPSTVEAQLCYDDYFASEWARSELAAEMRNERWFEDRGWAEALLEQEMAEAELYAEARVERFYEEGY